MACFSYHYFRILLNNHFPPLGLVVRRDPLISNSPQPCRYFRNVSPRAVEHPDDFQHRRRDAVEDQVLLKAFDRKASQAFEIGVSE